MISSFLLRQYVRSLAGDGVAVLLLANYYLISETLADEGSSLFVHLFVVTENKNSNSVHHHRVIRVSRTSGTTAAPSHYYSHHQPATMHSTHARTAPGLTPKGVPGPRAPSAIASNRAIGRLMTGIVRLVIGVIVDHPRRNKHATFGRFFTHDLTIFKEHCRPILSHPDHWVSSAEAVSR